MLINGNYVDNCSIIGKESSFLNLNDKLRKHELNLKIENNVDE
jgi:hypothetical protein